jgi:hypothetical protein
MADLFLIIVNYLNKLYINMNDINPLDDSARVPLKLR